MESSQPNNQNQSSNLNQSQATNGENQGGIFGGAPVPSSNNLDNNAREANSSDLNTGNPPPPPVQTSVNSSQDTSGEKGPASDSNAKGFGASPFVEAETSSEVSSGDSSKETPLKERVGDSNDDQRRTGKDDSSKPDFSDNASVSQPNSNNSSNRGEKQEFKGGSNFGDPKDFDEKKEEENDSKKHEEKEDVSDKDLNQKGQENQEKEEGVDWNGVEISDEVKPLMTHESASKYRFVPFEAGPDYIKVAIVDESDMNTQNALRFFANKNKKRVETFPISENNFEFLLNQFREDPGEKIGQFVQDFEKSAEEDQIKDLSRTAGDTELEVLKDAPVAKMVEVIIKNAIDGRASDIHVEPLDEGVRVRYRVDGILHNSISLPKKIGPAIVSRVKILSNLKIDEKRKPQDGRFRVRDLGRIVDFRVSTFPTSHGEKVVLRILDTQTGVIDVEDLGFQGRGLKALQSTIQEPFGIVLVTGPTGSGKSTTLYAVLKILNKEGINIVTLEDPVEYVLEGVNQSQVKPEIGYDFASGLRSILRQDPDVVMVGEIRDEETAELAIHAALTGHLVLSTLHTNSAVGGVARLVDMGIQPFLLSSALNLLIGQRLVRKICSECKEEIPHNEIPKEALDLIKREIKKMPEEALKGLKIEDPNKVTDQDIKLYRGKGCGRCHSSGYKGRMGIYEVLELNNELSKMVGDGDNINDIEETAKKGGYTIMKQDGIIKSLQGITTIEEVQRVTEDESEEIALEGKSG